jgi:DeoR family fructose operon transcriptional repressor
VRRKAIIDALGRDGAVRLEAAAEELGVSTMTVRRDIADLEAEGLLRRVRGGAVPVSRPRSFKERLAEGGAAKRVIASKSLRFMVSSGAVAVDASSTGGALLSAASRSADRIIATNSVQNHLAARTGPGGTCVLIGGELEEQTDSYVGPLACHMVQRLHYDVFFMSAAGVGTDGTTEPTLREAQAKRAFADCAEKTVLIADSSKLGQTSIATAFEWTEIDHLVTELDPEDARLEEIRGLVDIV